MTVSIVMAYYENPHMLEAHLYAWRQYSEYAKGNIEFLIVDDGSPRNPAAPLLRAHCVFNRIMCRCFRIDTNIPWNQDGARNLGMKHALSDWAFMTDMDHVIPPDQADKMLHFAHVEARQHEYYMPAAQIKTDGTVLGEHPNTYLFNRRDYWNIVGGYDEDFAGAYGSDGNFRKNATGLGLREVKTSAWHTIVFRKEDIFDACTHDFSRKDGPYYRANFPNLEAKRRAPAYRPERPIRFPWHQEEI